MVYSTKTHSAPMHLAPTMPARSRRQQVASLLAGACAIAIFPLIWVGGLVTTYDAGMAVPDWPATYGDSLWMYSWSRWLTGPWDLFIEHGHRLLGSVVGMLAIALMVVVWWPEHDHDAVPRRSLRLLSVILFLAVLGQGILGGLRVVMAERDLARIHGICGPLVFALACMIWSVASERWSMTSPSPMANPATRAWVRSAWLVVLVIVAQIGLGSWLRHVPIGMSPAAFRALVLAHVVVAFFAVGSIVVLAFRARSVWGGETTVSLHATRVMHRTAYFAVVQLGLGTATWIAKYSWPEWLKWIPGSEGYTVQAEGWYPSMIVTAHVAVGSLILANSAVCALWVSR